MKANNEHTNLQAIDEQSRAFFAEGTFNWTKNQNEVWLTIMNGIATIPTRKSIYINFKVLAIAASFIVFIAVGSFLRFYETTISTTPGIHQIVELPDGSSVELNAASTLKYHPYWWHFKRILELDGEGFFDVEKGNNFTVKSSFGETQVLGTSFNILSREEIYAVTCLTGRVQVTSNSKENIILKPNSKAEIKQNGKINVIKEIDTYPEISWRKNIFLFTATPLRNVFLEIERQYDVTIKIEIESMDLYTGNFTKNKSVEDILGYVCPALGLKYVKNSTKSFVIIEDSE